jgi:hypothetical protein
MAAAESSKIVELAKGRGLAVEHLSLSSNLPAMPCIRLERFHSLYQFELIFVAVGDEVQMKCLEAVAQKALDGK